MAETENNGAISIKTTLGEIVAKGPAVILVLILFGVAYVALMEHHKRSMEHDQIIETLIRHRDIIVEALEQNDCLNSLAIYQGLQPRGVINWEDMPHYMFRCIPKFMIEPKVKK